MLEEFTVEARTHSDFLMFAKAYNVNMTNRKIHTFPGCYDADKLYEFIPFDSMEEIEKFEKDHNVHFARCEKCFPDEAAK